MENTIANTSQTISNVIIIGGGPAGLSASLYAARANLVPLVLAGSPPGGQLMLTSEVENYPGFESIVGPDLIKKYRDHTARFGTQIVDVNATGVDFSKRPFEVVTPTQKYQAKAVIIAVGASALWLGLPSETRLRGRGVSACATCDGFFFKKRVVGVVGGGDTALEEALFLTKFASKVFIFHRRGEFRASKIMIERVHTNPKIEVVWNTAVTEVMGENKVEGVKLKKDSTESSMKLDGLFIAIGHRPDTTVFKDKILLDEKGYIVTSAGAALENIKYQISNIKNTEQKSKIDPNKFKYEFQTATSVEGVFAAGDCVDFTWRQAGTAAGMGIAAALDAERWLEANQ